MSSQIKFPNELYTRSQKNGDVFVLFSPIEMEVKRPFPIHNNGNRTGGGQCDGMCSRLFQL